MTMQPLKARVKNGRLMERVADEALLTGAAVIDEATSVRPLPVPVTARCRSRQGRRRLLAAVLMQACDALVIT